MKNREAAKIFQVLYVEDDKLVLKMVELWLSKYPNIKLQTCESMSQLKQIENFEFDLIATDHMLEDGNSTDVISYIVDKGGKDIPILVYTATTRNVDLNALKQLGNVLEVLPKPFDIGGFLAHLEAIS